MANSEIQVKKVDSKSASVEVQVAPKKLETLVQKLEHFDRFVFARDYKNALNLLANILSVLEGGKEGFGKNPVDTSDDAERQATIFCAAVTRMLSDPECKLGDNNFFALIPMKRALMQAFEVSGYRGTNHLLSSIGQKDDAGDTVLNRQEIIKLLLGLSINALSPNLVNLLLRQPVNIVWPLCIAFLSEQIVWSKFGQAARPRILAASEFLSTAAPKYQNVRNLGPAYMGCSYDESVHKHEIKIAMNSVARGWLNELGVEDAKLPETRRAVKKKPTVLILAELYTSNHAMHRCYGPSIASLKSDFKTILMAPSGSMDESLVGMFDKIDETKFDPNNPKAFIDKAKSYRPDIVYYTSIGMRLMSIVCSTVRLAPIQMFTPGHPATTYSDHIDYILLMEGCYSKNGRYSETVILRENQPYFEMRHDAEEIEPQIAAKPPTVKIAVPAWSRKVTPGFLDVCEQIELKCKQAGRPVEFWFFPNAIGSLYQGFRRRVQSRLTAKVFPRTNYNAYVKQLNQCDLFTSTFPFGATNSIVDAVIQGLPVINLDGDEAHARNDSDMLRPIDQPDWLSVKTVEEYVDATVKLVVDDALRVEISRAILACDPARHFLVPENQTVDDFSLIFKEIYQKHEALQASGVAAWRHEDLTNLSVT